MSLTISKRNGGLVIFSELSFYIRTKIKKSLRLHMIFVILLVGILSAFGMRNIMIRSFERRAAELKIADIQNQCMIFAKALLESERFGEYLSSEMEAELSFFSNVYNGRVLLIDKDFRIQKDTYEVDTGKVLVSNHALLAMEGESQSYYDHKNHYIEVMVPMISQDSNEAKGIMVVSVTTDGLRDLMDSMKQNGDIGLILIGSIALGIAALFAWLSLLPLKKMSKGMKGISEGNFDEKILEGSYEEIQELLISVQDMLEKIKLLDESRNEFVSNVSHELKTPLTSMKVLADTILHLEHPKIELYQEFMQDLSEEIERENRIISDLLSLVKMDKTVEEPEIKKVDLEELIQSIFKRLNPIARRKNIELRFEKQCFVEAEIDEIKFSLALSNLIENGIKYNKENGFVFVRLNADSKFFYIEVLDSGMGIPEEERERIFERFYRVDKSHSREIGGTGLGLSIARKAIIMHRGTIKVVGSEREGSCFCIRVPLIFAGVREKNE